MVERDQRQGRADGPAEWPPPDASCGAARLPARFVVYADQQDVLLAREAQRAGAFYEAARDQVHRALAAYLRATLPPHDRRNAHVRDRRGFMFRGGCRCTDGMGSEASV
jgi:hypothetical protein